MGLLNKVFGNPIVQSASDLVIPGSGNLENYFSGAKRNLPNNGGSYQSVVPAQTTAPAQVTPAGTAAAAIPGPVTPPAGNQTGTPTNTGPQNGGPTGNQNPTPTNSGAVTPEDFAYAANAITAAMGSQGDSARISGELTGLNNASNNLATGETNLFPDQTEGQAFTPEELSAMNKAQGSIYAPAVAAKATQLANAEESDVYSNKFQGPLSSNSFSPSELAALNNVAAGNSQYAASPAYISATAKIQEARKRGLDAQRFGYTQSIYGLGGTKVDTAGLSPVSAPVGSAAFKGPGADGSLQNANFGQPAYFDAQGNPLDANGNPWPATGNTYGNVIAQQKLSNDYVQALQKASSSRSGDLGTQNNKVSAAVHAMSLIQQNTDTAGNINLSSSQYQELAQSAAALISGSSGGTDSQINGLIQPTLAGTTNKILSYISGSPLNAATQANLKRLVETIQRQGTVAEQLRDAALTNQAIIPAGMDPARAKYDRAQANFPSFTSFVNGGPIGTNPLAPAAPTGGSSKGIYDF